MFTMIISVFFLLAMTAEETSAADDDRLNSWIDFCASDGSKALYAKPFEPVLSMDLMAERRMGHGEETTAKKVLDDRGQFWRTKHRNLQADARTKSMVLNKRKKSIKVMLYGDSITEYWSYEVNKVALMESFGRDVDNEREIFVNGISGDETSHGLYRIHHGAFPTATVNDIVLLIGTNDLGRAFRSAFKRSSEKVPECLSEEMVRAIRDETPKVVQGILSIVEDMRLMSPNSRIVVLGILPRGFRNPKAWKTVSQQSMPDMETSENLPTREVLESRAFMGQFSQPNVFSKAIDFINDAVKRGIEVAKVGGSRVYYKECNDVFLNEDDGNMKSEIIKDALHPDKPRGYEVFGKCIKEHLDQLPENWEFKNVRVRDREEQIGEAV